MPGISACRYDHLQFFVDDLKPLAHYKALEARLNDLAKQCPALDGGGGRRDVKAARAAWLRSGAADDSKGSIKDPEAFEVHGRDLVEQLLHGFG